MPSASWDKHRPQAPCLSIVCLHPWCWEIPISNSGQPSKISWGIFPFWVFAVMAYWRAYRDRRQAIMNVQWQPVFYQYEQPMENFNQILLDILMASDIETTL